MNFTQLLVGKADTVDWSQSKLASLIIGKKKIGTITAFCGTALSPLKGAASSFTATHWAPHVLNVIYDPFLSYTSNWKFRQAYNVNYIVKITIHFITQCVHHFIIIFKLSGLEGFS